MSIDTRQLRSLVAVAEKGHIGRAAQRWLIAPSPLSHQIRLLEKVLGAELLTQAGRRVRPR